MSAEQLIRAQLLANITRKKDLSAEITALSPNDKLFNNQNPSDYLKYESFLKSAFTNSRVRNIAITGNHGVGKSSIIRSYESNDKKRGKGYLYKDIDIVEVGLRPGEKLYEEQLIKTEELIATENKMIYIEQDELPIDFDRIESVIIELNNAIEQHYDSSVLVNLVKEIVPMYTTHIERENYASVG